MNCRTVLIVEDDPDIRETLREILEMERFPVLTAGNGQEALGVLRNAKRPCLILLDMMMPVMNGWEFLDAKSQDIILTTIPVVIVSAAGDRARSNRAHGFIKKPVEIDSLLRVVRQYCTGVAAQPDAA